MLTSPARDTFPLGTRFGSSSILPSQDGPAPYGLKFAVFPE